MSTSLKKSKAGSHSTHLSDHLEISSDLSAPAIFSTSADFPAPSAREPRQLPFIFTMTKLFLWHGHARLTFLCATVPSELQAQIFTMDPNLPFPPSFSSLTSQSLISEFLPLFLPPFLFSFLPLLIFILCKSRASGARRTSFVSGSTNLELCYPRLLPSFFCLSFIICQGNIIISSTS